MTTLELLQKDYNDLMKASLLGGLTESDLARAKALESEIIYWTDQRSLLIQKVQTSENVIQLWIKKEIEQKLIQKQRSK